MREKEIDRWLLAIGHWLFGNQEPWRPTPVKSSIANGQYPIINFFNGSVRRVSA
jgi:hypothetical protein